jgi:hypothetical protein
MKAPNRPYGTLNLVIHPTPMLSKSVCVIKPRLGSREATRGAPAS